MWAMVFGGRTQPLTTVRSVTRLSGEKSSASTWEIKRRATEQLPICIPGDGVRALLRIGIVPLFGVVLNILGEEEIVDNPYQAVCSEHLRS